MKLYVQFGRFARRKLFYRKDRRRRPVLSRLRYEAISFIKDFIPGARVLDLFAGTGILGIEALSLGAQHVTFVDKSKKQLEEIKQAISRLNDKKLLSCSEFVKADVLAFLLKALKQHKTYDIVFIDPPFDLLLKLNSKRQQEYVLELLSRVHQVTASKGVVLFKVHRKVRVLLPKELGILEVKRFGINRLYVLVIKKDVINKYKNTVYDSYAEYKRANAV